MTPHGLRSARRGNDEDQKSIREANKNLAELCSALRESEKAMDAEDLARSAVARRKMLSVKEDEAARVKADAAAKRRLFEETAQTIKVIKSLETARDAETLQQSMAAHQIAQAIHAEKKQVKEEDRAIKRDAFQRYMVIKKDIKEREKEEVVQSMARARLDRDKELELRKQRVAEERKRKKEEREQRIAERKAELERKRAQASEERRLLRENLERRKAEAEEKSKVEKRKSVHASCLGSERRSKKRSGQGKWRNGKLKCMSDKRLMPELLRRKCSALLTKREGLRLSSECMVRK